MSIEKYILLIEEAKASDDAKLVLQDLEEQTGIRLNHRRRPVRRSRCISGFTYGMYNSYTSSCSPSGQQYGSDYGQMKPSYSGEYYNSSYVTGVMYA